ncbi:MAG: hypothetical protein M3Q23_06790 [Actinomycetota bacterium]|nr:hypothetical protein [Actinomycetota bacterium]
MATSTEIPPGRRRVAPSRPALAGPLLLAAVAAGLLVFYLAPYVIRGYRFPIGADAPVYLWWTRLARAESLSAVGFRPGISALTLAVGGTLGLSPSQALGGLGAALAAATGLAAAGLVATWRGTPAGRTTIALAGLLGGLYAANLANGYLAALAVAALFLGAVACLTAPGRRRTVAAALLLAAATLAHPEFFLLAVAVLVLTGAAGLLPFGGGSPEARAESMRIGAALGGGLLVAGAGFGALLAGADPVSALTSKDALLRRAGLRDLLAHAYRSRLAGNWVRYLLPGYVPLAAAGLGRARGLVGRLFRVWALVAAAGIVAAWVTGLLPGERFLSFAFFLPILAALGLARLWGERPHRGRGPGGARWQNALGGRVGPVAAAIVTVALVVGSVFAWRHAAQFVRPAEVEAASEAARLAAATPPGTALVFVVDDADHPGFNVPRWENILRDSVPPSRVRQVYVYVGSPERYLEGRPMATGDPLRDALSRVTLDELRKAKGPRVSFLLAAMNPPAAARASRIGDRIGPGVFALGPHPEPLPAVPDPLLPSSPWMFVLAGIATLALLGAVGLGWSRAAVGPGLASLGLAPAFGAAALILGAVLLDRLGAPLSGPFPPLLSVVLGAGGHAVGRRGGRGVEVEVPQEVRNPAPDSKMEQ